MEDLQPTFPQAACAEDRDRVRDLGERLASEQAELARLHAICEESRKVVHALNNSLSIIATFAATLADEADDGAVREAADEIVRAVKKAGLLSRQLGDLQRKGSPPEGPGGQGRA